MTAADPAPRKGLRAYFTIRAPLVAWIVAVAFFMEMLDATVIVTALPNIARSFGVQTVDAGIGIVAYMLAVGVVLPASAWVADRFGPRNVFAAAIVIFTLTSLACAFSPNLWVFTAARAIQGGAAALMSPVGRLVVLRNTPKDRVIEAIGLVTWPGLVAPVIGPPLGGFIAEYWGWHWIFLINVPLGIAGIALVLRFVSNKREHSNKFDWRSFLLLGTALSSLLVGMEFVSHSTDALVPIALVVAGLTLGYFACRRMLRVDKPLLRLDTLKAPSFFVSNVTAGALVRAVATATAFLGPLMFQVGYGLSASLAGLMILPLFLGNLVMKMFTTPLLRTFGFWKALVASTGLNALGFAVLSAMPAPSSDILIWSFVILLFAIGLARSMSMTGLTTLTFADTPRDQMADANALSSVLWQLSQTIGVAASALLLRGAMLARGGESVGLADFRFTFGVVALACLAACVLFARMKRNEGEALTARG